MNSSWNSAAVAWVSLMSGHCLHSRHSLLVHSIYCILAAYLSHSPAVSTWAAPSLQTRNTAAALPPRTIKLHIIWGPQRVVSAAPDPVCWCKQSTTTAGAVRLRQAWTQLCGPKSKPLQGLTAFRSCRLADVMADNSQPTSGKASSHP